MVLRHFPDDRAFEHYLREHQLPYVAVDEAKRALHTQPDTPHTLEAGLKNFDFVVYPPTRSGTPSAGLLIDVKGRACRRTTFETWVSEDDITSLTRWQALFGPGFRSAFVFLHWWTDPPADGLFREIFEHQGRWYAPSVILLDDYTTAMKPRSPRWRTVSLPKAAFDRFSQPLARMLNTD
ncbi:HYExAFE family protein [Mucisphaera sp.]|uniref:HYExAFE family protein n=1 Tax=Mucisphaera sp. TaxID=2913024 RepID=UPI003D0FE6BC